MLSIASLPSEPIDLIVPVYRGLTETRRCLESVLTHSQTCAHEVIVIDDASPEPALVDYLDELAANQSITLLRQAINAGFVAAINRGIALHPERDVVLLNSDTEVNGDWLDRLARCAYADERVGTVTPFSNNATLCSYPHFFEENPLPVGLSLAELDGLFRQVNAGRWLDIPTGVGFCMYIRRACLTEIGAFDESRFGLGYGEENDFCMRASQAGWYHRLCADTFVYHVGNVSFSEQAETLRAQAQETLAVLHPEYRLRIKAFISADPVGELRLAVDQARAQLSPDQARQVVLEQHAAAVNLSHRYQQSVTEALALHQGLDQAERLLEETREALHSRDVALAEAQGYVRQREADIADLHQQAQARQEALERAAQDILTLEQQAEAARQAYGELQCQHEALNLRLEQIYASRSWRYTRFLRKS